MGVCSVCGCSEGRVHECVTHTCWWQDGAEQLSVVLACCWDAGVQLPGPAHAALCWSQLLSTSFGVTQPCHSMY